MGRLPAGLSKATMTGAPACATRGTGHRGGQHCRSGSARPTVSAEESERHLDSSRLVPS